MLNVREFIQEIVFQFIHHKKLNLKLKKLLWIILNVLLKHYMLLD